MIDLRQSPQWGKFLSQINWTIEQTGNTQIFIRPVPFFKKSLIKIQHPKNPLPLQKIDQIAKKYHALFVLIEPEVDDFNSTSLQHHGYKPSSLSLTHTATTRLDLSRSLDQIWASFSQNARRNIKKAQQNNLEIKVVNLKSKSAESEFKKFYDLLQSLTKLRKFYVPGFEEFYKKMLSFKNDSLLFFALKNSQPIACVWAATLNKTIYYMHTGITQEGYDLMANYLLVWEMVKTAKKLHLQTFDFEGIYDPRFPKERKKWANFSEFKNRFHGEIIEYPYPWIKFYSKIFKVFFLCNKIFPG